MRSAQNAGGPMRLMYSPSCGHFVAEKTDNYAVRLLYYNYTVSYYFTILLIYYYYTTTIRTVSYYFTILLIYYYYTTIILFDYYTHWLSEKFQLPHRNALLQCLYRPETLSHLATQNLTGQCHEKIYNFAKNGATIPLLIYKTTVKR